MCAALLVGRTDCVILSAERRASRLGDSRLIYCTDCVCCLVCATTRRQTRPCRSTQYIKHICATYYCHILQARRFSKHAERERERRAASLHAVYVLQLCILYTAGCIPHTPTVALLLRSERILHDVICAIFPLVRFTCV